MPIILYVFVIVIFMPILLAWIGGYFRLKQLKSIDNDNPRAQSESLSGSGARAVAAQQNAWEATIMFGGSLFVAFASNVDLSSLTVAGLLFLACRVLHPVFYILCLSTFRSISFTVGMATCVYIALSALF